MTREEAHLQRNVISLEPCFVQDAKMSKLINKIFDEHEAQVNHLELELMKKSNECDALQNAIDSLEVQLKAKDERIKELDCRAYHAEGYISDLHNEYPKHKKFLDTKARSIVAMLFWEWRKAKRQANDNKFYSDEHDDGTYWYCKAKEETFKQAYRMLKDTQ